MKENYCRFCKLIHNALVELCCDCGGELIMRPDTSNGADHSCPVCVREDNIEMA